MDTKDYVAIGIGLVGCVTGATALVRGWMLDRKLYWEPYFEKKWNRIGSPIRNNIEAIKSWLDSITRDLSEENPGKLLIASSVPPPIDHIKWSYDRRLHGQLAKYSTALTRFRATVESYNTLLSLLDKKTYRHLIIEGAFIGSGEEQVSDDDRQTHEATRQKAQDLIAYYCGSAEVTLEDLRSNKRLAADIKGEREEVLRSIRTLRKLLAPIEAAVDFYDTRFLS